MPRRKSYPNRRVECLRNAFAGWFHKGLACVHDVRKGVLSGKGKEKRRLAGQTTKSAVPPLGVPKGALACEKGKNSRKKRSSRSLRNSKKHACSSGPKKTRFSSLEGKQDHAYAGARMNWNQILTGLAPSCGDRKRKEG